MSLLDKILQASKNEPPCNDCEYLIYPKENLPFCKLKDKIILPDYPPIKCELRKGRD
jgi:hypothetical protein